MDFKDKTMRFGKISATLLAVVPVVIIFFMLFKPGWGKPIAILGVMAIISSVPAAFVLGLLGIILDKRKWLAFVTTIVAAILISRYFLTMLR